MEYRKLDKYHYVIRIDKGEEVFSSINDFCKWEDVRLGSMTGLGIASKIVVKVYNIDTKSYVNKEFNGSLEINNLIANITKLGDDNVINAHVNFSGTDFASYGGKLVECIIGVTCEIFITVINGEVNRTYNDEFELNLINL